MTAKLELRDESQRDRVLEHKIVKVEELKSRGRNPQVFRVEKAPEDR